MYLKKRREKPFKNYKKRLPNVGRDRIIFRVRPEMVCFRATIMSHFHEESCNDYESFKEDYKVLNTEVRKLGYNIPPLVNAYMSLSPTMRMFGTAINYGFGDVEETGILIAVNEILEEKRVRHIESFVKQHPESLKITSGAHPVLTK